MNKLEDFLTPTQKELFNFLHKFYKGRCLFEDNGFVLVKGEAPIMLLAHLDTVHKEPVQQICETQNGNILMSPQGIGGDDRCGVYALVTAYKQAKIKPWLLFTCDEETGGNGALKFCDLYRTGDLYGEIDELKMLIEIDRKGSKDAVYYDCANDEFEKYITSKGFATEYGSFSDISYVAPELGVAAVNLSSGYYNAHTLHEYINRKQLNATIKKVLEIIDEVSDPDFPKYEYIEAPHFSRKWGGINYHYPIDDTVFDDEYENYRLDLLEQISLAGVPDQLVEIYSDLIEFGCYDLDELEEIRAQHGPAMIVKLYHDEIGGIDDEDDTGEDKTELELLPEAIDEVPRWWK